MTKTSPSYLEANNWYGLAMTKKLHYDNFKWDSSFWTERRILNYDEERAQWGFHIGSWLPRETSWLAQRQPLSPGNHECFRRREFWTPERTTLQKYGKEAKDEDTKKLILNVMDKKKYALYFCGIKFYWLKLKKIHRIIVWSSHFWKPYIDFNTEKRTDDTLHDNLTMSWHDNQPRSSAITHPYIWSKNHYPEKMTEISDAVILPSHL